MTCDAEPIHDIPSFPGYGITTNGDVLTRHRRGRGGKLADEWAPMRIQHNQQGHPFVTLRREGACCGRPIRELLALTFGATATDRPDIVPIPTWEGHGITREGDVFRRRRHGRWFPLKAHTNAGGYRFVRLIRDGRYYSRYVPALLRLAFPEPDPPGVVPIPRWPNYFADREGNIYSKQWRWSDPDSGELRGLIPSLNHAGYPTVGLRRGGKTYTRPAHKLILETFVGPCPEGQQARHGRLGAGCAALSNLCYGTPKQNAADRKRDGTELYGSQKPAAKLREADIPEVRRLLAEGHSLAHVGRRFGVSKSAVHRVASDAGWTHVRGGKSLEIAASLSGRRCAGKLTAGDPAEVRRLLADGESQSAVARLYGVHPSAISKIALRKSWKGVA